jgi:hypothetical protein
MNRNKLIDLMVDIVKQRERTLYFFIENARKCAHQDRGIEGWFQTELIAELWRRSNKKEPIEHPYTGPDLILPNKTEIELRMTTSFNPGYTIDGMKRGKNGSAVLFFSGYLDYKKNDKKKKENEMEKKELKEKDFFEQEKVVKEWFKNQFFIKNKDNEISNKTGRPSFIVRYKTVGLMKEKAIVGIIEPSQKTSCDKIIN